ncbi:alpha/beta fold hydrolase [Streptomyces cyanogenus]|uniref:Alpha/beta hydrolase family protein n=1 Tax=Streptomyces cyanogenus TaxID=80860 RepID=A0ABX7U4S4_STRCY|nr:alpha/beta hydrolase [Streptomyces cyanogenus]QTE02934.1 Alpha/beta hydrolase family protein [Streptomyces cyanogenus]
MARCVLVAGAWLGSWAWDAVVPELRAAGHAVRALTLSGLAEKRGMPARLSTHVRDILGEVARPGVRDVVLVGHSYGGVPAAHAAGMIGDRLVRLVLVDAPVPADGASCVDRWPNGAAVEAAIRAHGGFWPPPDRACYAGQDLTDAQITWIMDRSTPHPGDTLTEPALLPRPLPRIPTTYVRCLLNGAGLDSEVAGLLTGGRWRLAELDTGHWPMFTRSRELAEILVREAAGRAAPAGDCGP